jgi:hypothetical protein
MTRLSDIGHGGGQPWLPPNPVLETDHSAIGVNKDARNGRLSQVQCLGSTFPAYTIVRAPVLFDKILSEQGVAETISSDYLVLRKSRPMGVR